MPRIVLPDRKDPRLRLAAVIITLQVLGQTVLGFRVSIAQILLSILACSVVEIALTYRKEKALVWPASALLTGNSVAFILRTPGTRHGDWWALNGIEWFLAASLAGLLSKYIVRLPAPGGGRHLYNPSNLGLVLVFLLAGPAHVYPQPLWWGPLEAPVVAALAVILAGGLWVLRPLRMLPLVGAFVATLFGLLGLLAARGGCFSAAWSQAPICGGSYWADICLSPELLVFVFFMITDPRTAPPRPRARLLYGVAVAAVAAGLIALEPSEYGIKVALLAALTVVCSLVPLLDRPARRALAGGRWSARTVATVAAAAAVLVAVPLGTAALATNQLALSSDLSPARGGSGQP